MEAVTCQPINKLIFSIIPESLLATNHWQKSLRTLGTRLARVGKWLMGWINVEIVNMFLIVAQTVKLRDLPRFSLGDQQRVFKPS